MAPDAEFSNTLMMPVLFHVGAMPIYSFGVLMSLAFLVAGRIMQSDFARKHEPGDLAWEIVIFGCVGGLLGARLHQALYAWIDFTSTLARIAPPALVRIDPPLT